MFPMAPRPQYSSAADSVLSKEALQSAVDTVLAGSDSVNDMKSVKIENISETGKSIDALTIVDWNAETVPITVQPVQTALKSDKTYWLIGVSGSLGLSIADWMIQNGATNLVVSSRNPQVDEVWLHAASHRGAIVRIMRNDVTDFESLRATYEEIKNTLPPLAGVAQGAMVLRDVATRDMTLEDLIQVLRPKVDGSLNLDRLLRNEPLDFCVFFSSLATVAGNLGQANYTAANAFMSGLAQQRRQRGAAASVIDLGPVLGAGVITRDLGDDVGAALAARGLLGISESDVHQIFAEAINSSHWTSNVDWQIATGFRKLPASAPNRPLWYTYPQFACFTLHEAVNEINHTGGQQAGISIKDQLANATSLDNVEIIITDSFTRELRNMLRLGDDYEIIPSTRTDELGLDSLVAVRIRSWFLNNFQVNIPALRILMGASLKDLVLQALEGVPEDLMPKLSSAQALGSKATDPVSSSSHGSTDGVSEQEGTPSPTNSQTDVSSVQDDPISSSLEDSNQHTEATMQRIGRISYTQSVFLFVHELLDDKTTLNNTGMLHLKGEIHVEDLSQAVQALGARHEALRTRIYAVDGQMVQGVMESPTLILEHKRVHTMEDVFKEYATLKTYNFDLTRGQTSRVLLLSYSPRNHYLLMSSHHIIFDRASTGIFLGDLERIYSGQSALTNPLQYLDYSNSQYDEYQSGNWKQNIDFWRTEFSTIPDLLPLHRSRISGRRPLERYASHIVDFRINQQMSDEIRRLARNQRATSFHVYLAAFKVLLYRFLGTTDVCIGIADSCRRDEHILTGVGPFLNMLPLRLKADPEQRISDSIAEARQKSLSILANALPFEVILDELRVVRESTHTPLAQAFLNYAESNAEEDQIFLGCQMQVMSEDQAELPYDIAFTVINNTDSDMRIILNVQVSLYTEQDAKLIAHGYEDILREFVANPEIPVGDKWNFRESVLQEALAVGNGPPFNSKWPQTLVHRFEEIVSSHAHRVAVADSNGNSLTYRNFSRRADQLAFELLQRGLKPDDKVAVFQSPTVDWVVSIIAILKIGAVYVPLDVATPVARLETMCTDCKPEAILVHEDTMSLVKAFVFSGETAIINVTKLPEKEPQERIPILAKPEGAAMILYTSGSTGKPKGVVLQHASLAHEFEHCSVVYGLQQHDIVLQQSAWSFDLSATQIFLALGVGAKLQIMSHTMRPDPEAMVRTILQCGVTATYATPTEYKSWLTDDNQKLLGGSSWKFALVAGEPVTKDLLELFRGVNRPALRLFNIYGPTETTCGSTKKELQYQDPEVYQSTTIPVGRASVNEAFYILDSNQNLQPIGQVGEVVIGGVGVAMGYFNDAALTRRSFISNPFATKEYFKRGWTNMYRTGDLGYLTSDGTLILKGRVAGDTEIKLNGVRVNLTDIEQTVLQASGGVLCDAVASLRSAFTSENPVQFVVVHVVFSSKGSSIDNTSHIQKLLQNLPLPHAMRPSGIIPIHSIPRTLSGKVDRRTVSALPLPSLSHASHDTGKPSALSETETLLRELWREVLPKELVQLNQVDLDADFFAVGGSSLLLIELQHKIKQQLDLSIPLLQLFQRSTLRSMAQLLNNEEEDDAQKSEHLDWDTETSIPSDLVHVRQRSLYGADNKFPLVPPRVIILTGATGFLGQHLLHALSSQEQVDKIICIATRNLQKRDKLFSVAQLKVQYYQGDLTLPRLGLDEDTACRIFREADVVIHNGADVSHLKTYASLRRANVWSTRELVRLCLPRNLGLHYISTAGVAMYTTSETMPQISARHSPPPTDGLYGYIASKWASEILLENVHAQHGLPVYIHRPSSIIRPAPDIAGDNPTADVIQNMLDYSQHISAVPAPVLQSPGTVDLVYPETVTTKVIQAVLQFRLETENKHITYIHESGDIELRLADIRNHVTSITGKDIKGVSWEEWVLRAQEMGLSDSMAAVFRSIGSGKPLNFPKLLRD